MDGGLDSSGGLLSKTRARENSAIVLLGLQTAICCQMIGKAAAGGASGDERKQDCFAGRLRKQVEPIADSQDYG